MSNQKNMIKIYKVLLALILIAILPSISEAQFESGGLRGSATHCVSRDDYGYGGGVLYWGNNCNQKIRIYFCYDDGDPRQGGKYKCNETPPYFGPANPYYQAQGWAGDFHTGIPVTYAACFHAKDLWLSSDHSGKYNCNYGVPPEGSWGGY